jgi:hypothetical protein
MDSIIQATADNTANTTSSGLTNIGITDINNSNIDELNSFLNTDEGNITIRVTNIYDNVGNNMWTSITTDSSSLTYDKTAPIVSSSQNTYTTQENNATTMSNFFSISANDSGSGLRADSFGKSGSGVDDAKISVNSTTGAVTLVNVPDFETQENFQVQLQAQDKAGNIATKDINITVTDIVEFAIADAIYIKDDNRTGTVQDSFYIIFSEEPNSATITLSDLSDYDHNLSASFVSALSNSRYITGAGGSGWAHIFDVTGVDINTSQNFTIRIGGTIASPNIVANGGNPTEVSYNESVFGTEVQDINYNGVDNNLTYKSIVVNEDLSVWLDRNLGATQVATSTTDTNAYGDLYQWGRLADGHQLRSNPSTHSTTTLATDLNATNLGDPSEFIINSASPYDWVDTGVDDDGSLRQQRLR